MSKQKQNSGSQPDPRRRLPSVTALLNHQAVRSMAADFSRPIVVEVVRLVLQNCRRTLKARDTAPTTEQVIDDVQSVLEARARDRLRPVINATGILLHTGLGRAVLPTAATRALAQLDHCCNLQIDLETGLRGKRNYMSEQLLARLTGAEAAIVVNNNAAATLLILASLCSGREVVVSRGQLIEIGGSFRLPDCIHQSGAQLVEVGTTNKTHLRDYEQVLNENTAAVMRVNPSNYRVVGFAKEVPVADLVTLKKKRDVLVIDDLGCGALVDLADYGLPHEPTVQESVEAGADIVCFSGDKLIGGPQAGIIVGKAEVIHRIRKHPLTRMLRVGKLTDLALEKALRLFLEPDRLKREHPTLRMLAQTDAELKRRATRLRSRLRQASPTLDVQIVEGQSAMGGGSLPAIPIATWLVAVKAPSANADELCGRLRLQEPPVVARVQDNAVVLDLRTIFADEEKAVINAVTTVTAP